jgi:hypothetical protein
MDNFFGIVLWGKNIVSSGNPATTTKGTVRVDTNYFCIVKGAHCAHLSELHVA